MFRLRYDSQGRVFGLPDVVLLGQSAVFEIVGIDEDLDEATSPTLRLSLVDPKKIEYGEWSLTFGAGAATILATEVSAYSVETVLNRVASIVAAGGVTVSGDDGLFRLAFVENGARSALTIAHSALGTLSGRCRVIQTGTGSLPAIFELDLSSQTLALATSGDAIDAAEVTVATINAGDADEKQRDSITISRMPDRGKMQIWTASDEATPFFEPSISAYQLAAILKDTAGGDWEVSRQTIGESIVFDVQFPEVGTNDALTAADTFYGPTGLEMTLDLTLAAEYLRLIGRTETEAVLTFGHAGGFRFSQPVRLASVLNQADPI